MTCILLLLIAIPSKWTLRKFPAQQPMQESIFKLQQLWIQAPLEDGLEMKTESYGFTKKCNNSWYCYLQA